MPQHPLADLGVFKSGPQTDSETPPFKILPGELRRFYADLYQDDYYLTGKPIDPHTIPGLAEGLQRAQPFQDVLQTGRELTSVDIDDEGVISAVVTDLKGFPAVGEGGAAGAGASGELGEHGTGGFGLQGTTSSGEALFRGGRQLAQLLDRADEARFGNAASDAQFSVVPTPVDDSASSSTSAGMVKTAGLFGLLGAKLSAVVSGTSDGGADPGTSDTMRLPLAPVVKVDLLHGAGEERGTSVGGVIEKCVSLPPDSLAHAKTNHVYYHAALPQGDAGSKKMVVVQQGFDIAGLKQKLVDMLSPHRSVQASLPSHNVQSALSGTAPTSSVKAPAVEGGNNHQVSAAASAENPENHLRGAAALTTSVDRAGGLAKAESPTALVGEKQALVQKAGTAGMGRGAPTGDGSSASRLGSSAGGAPSSQQRVGQHHAAGQPRRTSFVEVELEEDLHDTAAPGDLNQTPHDKTPHEQENSQSSIPRLEIPNEGEVADTQRLFATITAGTKFGEDNLRNGALLRQDLTLEQGDGMKAYDLTAETLGQAPYFAAGGFDAGSEEQSAQAEHAQDVVRQFIAQMTNGGGAFADPDALPANDGLTEKSGQLVHDGSETYRYLRFVQRNNRIN